MKLQLGKHMKNRKILYWAAKPSNSVLIKDARIAYGNFSNHGIICSNKNGEVTFNLKCSLKLLRISF